MDVEKVVTPVATDNTNTRLSPSIAEEAQKLQDLLMAQKELLPPEIFQASIAPFITVAEPADPTTPVSLTDTSLASSSSKRPLSFCIQPVSAKRRITPRSLPSPSPLRISFAALAQFDNSDKPSPTQPTPSQSTSSQPNQSNSTPLHLTRSHSTPSQLNPTKPVNTENPLAENETLR